MVLDCYTGHLDALHSLKYQKLSVGLASKTGADRNHRTVTGLPPKRPHFRLSATTTRIQPYNPLSAILKKYASDKCLIISEL
jgi:hypothetical protein